MTADAGPPAGRSAAACRAGSSSPCCQRAIGVGALSAESSVRLFPGAPSTDAMAVLPLSLIPTFGVPIFVLLHVVSLLGLRARANERADPSRVGAAPALSR